MPQWTQSNVLQKDYPEAHAFLVKSKKGKGHRVWTKAGYERQLRGHYPNSLQAHRSLRKARFKRGKALLNLTAKVNTCGGEKRPGLVMRSVHGRHEHGGTKARAGRGADPVDFQEMVRLHAVWRYRRKTPFLSVTTDPKKIVRMCALYEARGFKNIEILVIRTYGSGWDHSKQRIWDLKTLAFDLNLPVLHKPYHENEYLIEHSIPEQCVQRFSWDLLKKKLDSHRQVRERESRKFRGYQRRKAKKEAQKDDLRADATEKAENTTTQDGELAAEGAKTRKMGEWCKGLFEPAEFEGGEQ